MEWGPARLNARDLIHLTFSDDTPQNSGILVLKAALADASQQPPLKVGSLQTIR